MLVSLYVAMAFHSVLILGFMNAPSPSEQSPIGPHVELVDFDDGKDKVNQFGSSASDLEFNAASGAEDRIVEVGGRSATSDAQRRSGAPQRPNFEGRGRLPGLAELPELNANVREGGGGIDNDYLVKLRIHLARFRRALPVGSGEVVVKFELSPDGTVRSPQLLRSSGWETLDREAVALLLRASPLPAPPVGAATSLVVPIVVSG